VEINIPCSIKVPHTFENNNMQLPVKDMYGFKKKSSLNLCQLMIGIAVW
jgi:hypothetical protein